MPNWPRRTTSPMRTVRGREPAPAPALWPVILPPLGSLQLKQEAVRLGRITPAHLRHPPHPQRRTFPHHHPSEHNRLKVSQRARNRYIHLGKRRNCADRRRWERLRRLRRLYLISHSMHGNGAIICDLLHLSRGRLRRARSMQNRKERIENCFIITQVRNEKCMEMLGFPTYRRRHIYGRNHLISTSLANCLPSE